MSATAVVIMIVILGFVWGGFVVLATMALRKERAKTAAGPPEPPGGPPDPVGTRPVGKRPDSAGPSGGTGAA